MNLSIKFKLYRKYSPKLLTIRRDVTRAKITKSLLCFMQHGICHRRNWADNTAGEEQNLTWIFFFIGASAQSALLALVELLLLRFLDYIQWHTNIR